MKKILSGLIVLFLVAGVSCDFSRKYEIEERQLIQNYLISVGDTIYKKTPSGLYYFIIFEGPGSTPAKGDTVAIWYKVKYLTGKFFDSNYNQSEPFSFIVGSNSVIQGIDEGVRYMKGGGKAKFITPSGLAYGAAGLYVWDSYGNYLMMLPGYTPLVWEVEIASVNSGLK